MKWFHIWAQISQKIKKHSDFDKKDGKSSQKLFTNSGKKGIINNSMKRALITGSFDPVTLGHIDIISRALKMFGHVYVGVGINVSKSYLLSNDERCRLIAENFEGENVTVFSYDGLTADIAREYEIDFIIRGIRNVNEYEVERQMAEANYKLSGIETLFLPTKPELSYLSSGMVKEIYTFSKDISKFVPKNVAQKLK